MNCKLAVSVHQAISSSTERRVRRSKIKEFLTFSSNFILKSFYSFGKIFFSIGVVFDKGMLKESAFYRTSMNRFCFFMSM